MPRIGQGSSRWQFFGTIYANTLAQPLLPGPPYPPQTAQLGGSPTTGVDDPICGVLIFLFAVGAVANMAVFQMNRKIKHKFVFSVLLFGFCLARIVSLIVRIVWAESPLNIPLGLAANILTAAGVLLLFIVNLIFAQRMIRAYHPEFGWTLGTANAFRVLYASLVVGLALVIVVIVQSFYTLDATIRSTDRVIQLLCASYFTLVAFLPLPILAVATLFPHDYRIQKFGSGSFRMKLALIGGTAALLTLGAGFRLGVAADTRPLADPAWFTSKAAFYCFNYVIEILIVFAYTASRFDRRFHVPDGSSGPGDYAGLATREKGLRGMGRTAAGGGSSSTIVEGNAVPVSRPDDSRQGVKTARSSVGGHAGGLVAEPDPPARDAATQWMEQAMRELYGEDHPQTNRQ